MDVFEKDIVKTESFTQFEAANNGRRLATMTWYELTHAWNVIVNELENTMSDEREAYLLKCLYSVEHYMEMLTS